MSFLRKLFLPITAPIGFIQNHFKAVLFVTVVIFLLSSSDPKNLQKPNLQKIDLIGTILDAQDILAKIEKAKNDKNIKGVLLNVNSPGGAVAPSVEIYYAIKDLSKTKPVVAYASGIMASGSYYSSIGATKIVANPGSMIGSIGVIMQSIDASELMKTIGIKTQTVKAGKYKEVGTPTRSWTKTEKDELNKVIQSTYDMFVKDVEKERKLQKIDKTLYADAHIFTAIQAQKVGLVDEVAPLLVAKKELEILSKVAKPIWAKEDKLDRLVQKLVNSSITHITNNMNQLMAY